MNPDFTVQPTVKLLAPARDEAFRKLGRNIALFQRLEQGLKSLSAMLVIEGSTEEDIAASHRGRRDRVARKSLGEVAGHVLGELSSNADDAPVAIAPGKTFGLRTSFRMEGDEYLGLKKKALAELVRERNRLVHHLAEDYDLQDPGGISRLDALLDSQAERIRAELRWLDETSADYRQCLEALRAGLADVTLQGCMPGA